MVMSLGFLAAALSGWSARCDGRREGRGLWRSAEPAAPAGIIWMRSALVTLLALTVLVLGWGATSGFAEADELAGQVMASSSPHEAPVSLPAQDQVRADVAVLQQVRRAVVEQPFEGVFVHDRGGQVSVYQVQHLFHAGKPYDRMVSLSGEAREMRRMGDWCECVWPAAGRLIEGPFWPASRWERWRAEESEHLLRHYRVLWVGEDRVAGWPVRLLELRPHDQARYSYRLWLNQVQFPLRTEIVNPHGVVLDRTLYTRFVDELELPPEQLHPPLDRAGYQLQRLESDRSMPLDANAPELPLGFMVLELLSRPMQAGESDPGQPGPGAAEGERQAQIQVLMSDGLARVSGFVELGAAAAELHPDQGHGQGAQMHGWGATHATLRRTGDYTIRVMGEVPAATIDALADALVAVEWRGWFGAGSAGRGKE